MADIGNAEALFVQAQNVALLASAATTANAALVDTIVLMRNVRFGRSHARTRTDHGATKTYNHSSPDLTLSFSGSGSTDIIQYLLTRNTLTSRNILPTYRWQVRITPQSGSAVTVTFQAKLEEFNFEKSDGAPSDPTNFDASLLITSDTFTVA